MDRTEKIDAISEFLDENHIKIIDAACIGSVVVDAEQTLNKIDNNYEYDELLGKGLTENDIESFKKFLEKNALMMIKPDEISGVSFENSEYYIEGLDGTGLWDDEVEDDEKGQFVKKTEEDRIMETVKKGIMDQGYDIEDEIKTDNSIHVKFTGNGKDYVLNLLKLE
jgi:hypothetical protein